MAKIKQRSDNQTVSSFSCSKDFLAAVDTGRTEFQMDRSTFIRYCVAKELKRLDVKMGKG